LLFAARQAQEQQIMEISAIEFGVAGGAGLVTLQNEAEAVTDATGVSIHVYGFDAGPGGLPTFCGDYRDHPDIWKPGDYPMDVDQLRAKLSARTSLILGDISHTVEKFRNEYDPRPIGFISVDVDLYSSTVAALRVLDFCSVLRRVAIYFDDIDFFCHRWAGELLAIAEFNESHPNLKIDRWRGLRTGRPFPEHQALDKMFICHDLQSISRCELSRQASRLPL
jgi:hypothetical protein